MLRDLHNCLRHLCIHWDGWAWFANNERIKTALNPQKCIPLWQRDIVRRPSISLLITLKATLWRGSRLGECSDIPRPLCGSSPSKLNFFRALSHLVYERASTILSTLHPISRSPFSLHLHNSLNRSPDESLW